MEKYSTYMSPEDRLEALATVLAEGLVYLAEHGELVPEQNLNIPSEEGKCVTVPERP